MRIILIIKNIIMEIITIINNSHVIYYIGDVRVINCINALFILKMTIYPYAGPYQEPSMKVRGQS